MSSLSDPSGVLVGEDWGLDGGVFGCYGSEFGFGGDSIEAMFDLPGAAALVAGVLADEAAPAPAFSMAAPLPMLELPVVATMVVVYRLHGVGRTVPLRDLAIGYRGNVVYDPTGVALVSARGGRRRRTFGNSLHIMGVLNGRRGAAFVFTNGSLKITGVQTLQQADRCAQRVASRMRDALRRDVTLGVRSVSLTKADADLGFAVSLRDAQQHLAAAMGSTIATFEPELYAGLKLRQRVAGLAKDVSVILFNSGKVQIAAKASEAQLQEAWVQFTAAVAAVQHLIKQKPAEPAPRATVVTGAVAAASSALVAVRTPSIGVA